jgi:TetR/AcrR family transcriptional repressor of nem operon
MPWEKRFDIDETLEKAMRVFWARGYEATSMQALVQAMGINRGSLYDTFGGKRQLFLAALHRYDERNRRARLEALERGGSPRGAIEALFRGWIDAALEDAERSGCFLTNTALELAVHDREVGDLVARSQQETESFFMRLVERGQSEGEIPLSVDAPATARALLAALIGLLVLARSRPDAALLQSIADSAMASLD